MHADLRLAPRTERETPAVRALLEQEGISPTGLDHGPGFVLLRGGEVVAHIGIELAGDGFAVLHDLVVARPLRGRGLTDLLARRIEDFARERRARDLVIFSHNEAGDRWAAERGFLRVDLDRLRRRSYSLFGDSALERAHSWSRPVLYGLLFVEPDNASLSLVAEGLTRRLAPEDLPVYSAGVEPGVAEPLAGRTLREVDVDPAGLHPKPLAEIPIEEVNIAVLLGGLRPGDVKLPGEDPLHEIAWEVPDPREGPGDENLRLVGFRDARDELRKRLERWFGGIAYSEACPTVG